MNNMLTRGILRLSKRGSKSGSVSSDSQSITSGVSEVISESNGTGGNDEWTKYDERLIDCINKSDITKLKDTLKKKGVSPVKVSRVGKTAFHIAVKKRCLEAVDLMLLEHPDLSCIDNQGRTVYHIAAVNGDTIMLKKLLDYSKWNLDIKDIKGMTALHYAVKSGDAQCVKLLLENDSPVEIKDLESRTPLLLAVGEECEKIATILIEHGVNVNEQDKLGRSAIVIACSLGMTQIVSLLISKGADRSVMNRKSVNLDKIAIDAGHSEIVEILNRGIENGNDDSLNPIIDSNGHVNGVIPVNGHNGHSELNGKMLDLSIDDSLPIENGHEEKKEKNQIAITIENGSQKNSSPLPSIQITPSATLQRRSVYNNDDSLTSAIIESLMGFDGKSDTVSETSVTEDQLHLYEKGEQERKELKATLAQKELRIEELQAEIDSLKNKVGMEMELRYNAEKEVQQLKLDLETNSQRSECEAEQAAMTQDYVSSERLSDDGISTEEDQLLDEDEKQHVIVSCEDDDDDNDTVNNDEVENADSDEVNGMEDSDYNGKNVHIENEIVYIENNNDEHEYDIDAYSSQDSDNCTEKPLDGNIPDSDTDDSVSATTGYRKRSLGTAKQHINMLEERILCLEDELSYKGEEIIRLQLECKNAKELVDLNNNTTVPLEIHNELKSDTKRERNAFKEQISTLEERVRQLEDTVEEGKREKSEVQAKLDSSSDLENKLNHEIETNRNLRKQIEDLHNQINILRKQIEVSEKEVEETENQKTSKEVTSECGVESHIESGELECTNDDNETKLHCDIHGHAEMEEQVKSLQEKADNLQEQLSGYDQTLEETLLCYRNTLISLYQNNLDSRLEEILASIVKLRPS